MAERITEIDKSQYKDKMGRYRTQSLFFETNLTGIDAIFTLKEEDHEYNGKHYISLKRIYLEMEDPGEYEFATTIFGTWTQWERICNNGQLKVHIERWREELAIKIEAKALREVIKTANKGGKDGQQAARWLASGQYKNSKGRPSKAEVEGMKKHLAGIDEELSEDAERMGVH